MWPFFVLIDFRPPFNLRVTGLFGRVCYIVLTKRGGIVGAELTTLCMCSPCLFIDADGTLLSMTAES